MGYTLRSAITAGRIDSESLGSFEIRDSELEAEDYDTAAALVEQYSVEWPDGDPGPDDTDADSEAQAEDVDVGEDAEVPESEDTTEDEDEAEVEDFNAQAFVDRTPMREVTDDIKSGDYDDHLDAIEDAAKRQGVQKAVENRRGD